MMTDFSVAMNLSPPHSPPAAAQPPEAPAVMTTTTTVTITESTGKAAEASPDASSEPRKRRADSFDSDIEIDIFDLLERSRRCTTIVRKTFTPASTSSTPSAPTVAATQKKTQRPRQASTKPDVSRLKKPKAKRKPGLRSLPRAGVDVWVEIPRRKCRLVQSAESEISQSLDPDSERPVCFKSEAISDDHAGLRAENASLRQLLDTLNPEIASLRLQLNALYPENASLRAQLDALRPENATLRAQLDALEAEKRVTDAWVASAASPHSSTASREAAIAIGRLLEDKRVQAHALVSLRSELEALKSSRPEVERINVLWRENKTLRSELGMQMTRTAQVEGERERLRHALATEIATTARLRSEAARLQATAKEKDAEVERLFAECEASDQKHAQLSAQVDTQRAEVTRLEAYISKLETNVAHALGQLAETEDARRSAHGENVKLREQRDAVVNRVENFDAVHAAQALEQVRRECDEMRWERDLIKSKLEQSKEANESLHRRMKELSQRQALAAAPPPPPPPAQVTPPAPPSSWPSRPWTPPQSTTASSSRPRTGDGPDPRDQELSALRLTIARMTREVSSANTQRRYAAEQLERAEQNSKSLRAEIARGDRDLAKVQRENITLRSELANANTAIGLQRAEIAGFGATLNKAVDEVSQAYEARRYYEHGVR